MRRSRGNSATMKQSFFAHTETAVQVAWGALAVGCTNRHSPIAVQASWQAGLRHCAASAARPWPQAQSVCAPHIAQRAVSFFEPSGSLGRQAIRVLSHCRCAGTKSHNQALNRTTGEFLAKTGTPRCGSRLAKR